MDAHDVLRQALDESGQRDLGEVRDSHSQNSETGEIRDHAMCKFPRAIPEVESPQLGPVFEELCDGLEETKIIIMPDHDEPEDFEVWQERVLAVNNVVRSKHDAR